MCGHYNTSTPRRPEAPTPRHIFVHSRGRKGWVLEDFTERRGKDKLPIMATSRLGRESDIRNGKERIW